MLHTLLWGVKSCRDVIIFLRNEAGTKEIGSVGIFGEYCYLWVLVIVEEHRCIGGNITSRLDHGAFAGLIYS